MTEDDIVYESVNGKRSRAQRSYHTDRDCYLLGENSVELSLSKARRLDLSLCPACDPDAEYRSGGSRSTLEAVRQHVLEERDEDPLADTHNFADIEEAEAE